ncbi:MAG: aminopeptidase P family protein [Rhodospirillales bacterium]|nr:aminopeptidase P family protein [Rhodospirillales bacterium]
MKDLATDDSAPDGTVPTGSDLAALLRDSNARPTLEEARALIRGVAAAPPGFDPDAWMLLIADFPSPNLRLALAAALAAERTRQARPGADRATRLAAFRAELATRKLDGFVVPRSDEYQGEYVPARSERLAWLTGFTGSAGVAVVLREYAVLFVDGRYTTQAATEVDAALFEIRHLTRQPLTTWLAEALPAHARLGFDPWLHTPNAVSGLQRACSRAQATAVPVESNPIDAVWRDQPPAPLAPVIPHRPPFAIAPSGEKRRLLADGLRRDGHDAAFLGQPDGIAWLLDIRGGDVPFTPLPLSFALLHADARAELFIDPRKLLPETRLHLGDDVSVASPDALAAALDALAADGRTVRVDFDAAAEWVAQRLRQGGAVVAEAADPCALPKATKTAAELSGMRAAHLRDGVALTRFLCWLDGAAAGGGLSEAAAALRLAAFRADGAHYRGDSFPAISAAGAHGAIVHYRVSPTSDAPLLADSLYLVDSGGQYLDGTTDVTRTICIGTPTAEMRERFTLVLKGHIAVARAVFPRGTTGSQLDGLARAALWRAGLDYDHGTGHGVGSYLGVHEGPQRISKLPSRVPLQPGMIVSNEPGYYKPGAYGIRIENLVAVVAQPAPAGAEQDLLGFETLTLAPIDRRLIEEPLLTSEEAAWLDGYHRQVAESLSPLVGDPARDWLAAATRPIRA